MTRLCHKQQPKYVARASAEKLLGRMVMEGIEVVPVGSATLQDYLTVPNDFDYLVRGVKMKGALINNGYKTDTGSEVPDSEFISMSRKFVGGTVNFILAKSDEFFDQFVASQHIVTANQVREKKDRVAIFEGIREGKDVSSLIKS